MLIEPRLRGFICLTAHPVGCAENVKSQINYVQSKEPVNGPKRVLVIGASTGFGLASRITSAFSCKAATIGVYFEKAPEVGKTASAGWYNTAAFEQEAMKQGLFAKSINGDAFSDEIKRETIALIKDTIGQVDLIIYSLASPKRVHPKTGIIHNSVLKPIGEEFHSKTVDFHSGKVSEVAIKPASESDIENTTAVMGGEDWNMWITALKDAGALANDVVTVAYSYIGPELTKKIYREGTIGKAKDHLENTVTEINKTLDSLNGNAYVSVNKALVTQASSAIPVVPLYMALLFKIMKAKGTHEGCIEQIYRLFAQRLYQQNSVPLDNGGRIRIDDWEMSEEVQQEVASLWDKADTETLPQLGDLAGYRADFLNLFGFHVPGVDYNKDVNEMVDIPGLVSQRN